MESQVNRESPGSVDRAPPRATQSTTHRHGAGEDDDEHDDVEGGGDAARLVEHLLALVLGPHQEARRAERDDVAHHVERREVPDARRRHAHEGERALRVNDM